MIEKIFLNINLKQENIELSNKGLIKIINYENLIGINFFWNVIIGCEN